jgi:hypothetical protein
MTGFWDQTPRCPNGHPAAFTGQRFCEVCGAEFGAAAPSPVAPQPATLPPPVPPPAWSAPPPTWSAPQAPPPTWSAPAAPPPFPGQAAAGAPTAAGARGGGSKAPLVAGLVIALAVAGGAAFILLANPFGGTSPTPTASAVAGAVTFTPRPPSAAPQTKSAPPSPQAPTPTPGEPTEPPAAPPTAPPTVPPTSSPTVPPTAPPISPPSEPPIAPPSSPPGEDASAVWTAPDLDAKLASNKVKLEAWVKPFATDITVTGVTFHAAWGGGDATLCEGAIDPDGFWGCSADFLKLSVPPGPLTLTFDVTDSVGHVTPAAAGELSVTYAVAPPKPTGAKLTEVSSTLNADQTASTLVEKVIWTAPAGYATEFRLYAVTYCPNDSPTAKDGTPCLSPGTPLKDSQLRLVQKADGNARSMTLTHSMPQGLCGPTVWCDDTYALVLGAYNVYGQSVFTIVSSIDTCKTCTY